jgi:hypothetical protein
VNPRYLDIAETLRGQLRKLAPNSLLPSEQRLARRFGVSRVNGSAGARTTRAQRARVEATRPRDHRQSSQNCPTARALFSLRGRPPTTRREVRDPDHRVTQRGDPTPVSSRAAALTTEESSGPSFSCTVGRGPDHLPRSLLLQGVSRGPLRSAARARARGVPDPRRARRRADRRRGLGKRDRSLVPRGGAIPGHHAGRPRRGEHLYAIPWGTAHPSRLE